MPTSNVDIVIVGCGFPQLGLIRTARALGLRVGGLDMNAEAVAVPLLNEFINISTNDADGIVTAVNALGARAITSTGSDVALRATATAALALGLPFYATPDIVRRCQDKDAMRARYKACGLRVPKFMPCTTLSKAKRFAAQVGYPVVVKPARGWGQRGVSRVNTESELASAFKEALMHSELAGLRTAIVEEWVIGKEYSVNGFIENGTHVHYSVTERLTVSGNKPLGIMLAERYPSGLAPEQEQLVVMEAQRGAKALGHQQGPCYSQVAFDAQSGIACLFETAARMGGGFDADVTKLASGVDLYARILGLALSDHTLLNSGVSGPKYPAVVAKFKIGIPGMLTQVQGLDEARALPGVVDAQVFVPLGGTVHPLTDSAKRAGYVLAYGASREEVLDRANKALDVMVLKTTASKPPCEYVNSCG